MVPDRAKSNFHIFSFDLFDTLVTRIWLKPAHGHEFVEARCVLLQRKEAGAPSWCSLRIQAEHDLRTKQTEGEVTLVQIYELLRKRAGWTDEQSAQVMAVELQCEYESLRPIRPMVKRLNNLAETGSKVVVISDFYAPKSFILAVLSQAQIRVQSENVFVSSEANATKRTGKLFPLVSKTLGVAADQICHVGDHVLSDVKQARRAGMSIAPFLRSAIQSREAALYLSGSDLLSSLQYSAVAGAARRARLDFEVEHGSNAAVCVATSVAGPLLSAYVLWILGEARKDGIKRLYFLSRDGQILLRIARELAQSKYLEFDLRYLFASRRAWFLASTAFQSPDVRIASVTTDDEVVPSQLFARLGFKADDYQDVFEMGGFPQSSWGTQISDARLPKFRDLWCRPPLSDILKRIATEEYLHCGEYLRGAGVLDGISFAIVDVGWKGRLQVALSRIVARHTDVKVIGFYMALRQRPAVEHPSTMRTFLEGAEARYLNPSLVEVFCAADHATVCGYRKCSDASVEPLLAVDDGLAARWGVREFQECVLSYARNLVDASRTLRAPLGSLASPLRNAAVLAMRHFVDSPTREEAAVFGDFPHDPGQLHADIRSLAPRLSNWRLFQAVIRPAALNSRTHWQQATIMRSAMGRWLLPLWTVRVRWKTMLTRLNLE